MKKRSITILILSLIALTSLIFGGSTFVVGAMFDLTKKFSADGEINYWSLFFYAPACFALALLCMSQVKHGETNSIPEEMIEEIAQDD